ncbi:MAG TPA: lysylphosphatidylglycerol synthase domain-containing protein [Gemmatimonadales bacterium]|nr:lysylphosphatidylglycerol synthase domain-containing protein [Gemmatimonadales bacterium]
MKMALWQHGLAFALVLTDMFLRALRSQVLMPMPLRRALVVNTCADAASAVTPGRIGGDPVRFVAWRRAGHPASSILMLCGSEIAVDAVSLVLVAAILSWWFPVVERQFLNAAFRTLRDGWPWALGFVVLAWISVLVSRRYVPQHVAGAGEALRGAWLEARYRPPTALVAAAALTITALLVRCAILPVLLVGVPGLSVGQVLVGSAALVYGQQLAPTPAGLGAVELGAVAGLGGVIPPAALAMVVIIWRTYALVLGALAGAGLLYSYRRASTGSSVAA